MSNVVGCAGALLLGVALSAGSAPRAQADPPAPPPSEIPRGGTDITKAPSGTYTLDVNHVGVIARVSHLGFSFSIFRFDRVKGLLIWNGEEHGRSKLSVSVQTGSIATNVPGFAAQLTGAEYLNTAKFAQANFVSTQFRQTDATHGKVDGRFTLMGVTRPITFDATLVGAGRGFAGGPVIGHVIGVHAEAAIIPTDYGLPSAFSDPVDIVVDAEFDRAPPK